MVCKHNIEHNVTAKVMNEWFINITYNTTSRKHNIQHNAIAKVMNEWFVNITYNKTS